MLDGSTNYVTGPVKVLETGFLLSFPDSISHMLSQLTTEGISCVLWSLLGEDPKKVAPGFLETLSHTFFLFVDYASYLFTVMNLSHE